jgi:hypothetical protein
VRRATLVLVFATLAGCNDLRGFEGEWTGKRVGDTATVKVGLTADSAQLAIDSVDAHGLRGRLSVGGTQTIPIESLAGAEADVLGGMTFSGSPLRVYLAFAALPDGAGDALAVVALYADRRVELRLLRGETHPIYAIFAMTEKQ